MSNDTSREAFEAWAKDASLDCNTREYDAWGKPVYMPHIESMWVGWQASREQALEEVRNANNPYLQPHCPDCKGGPTTWKCMCTAKELT